MPSRELVEKGGDLLRGADPLPGAALEPGRDGRRTRSRAGRGNACRAKAPRTMWRADAGVDRSRRGAGARGEACRSCASDGRSRAGAHRQIEDQHLGGSDIARAAGLSLAHAAGLVGGDLDLLLAADGRAVAGRERLPFSSTSPRATCTQAWRPGASGWATARRRRAAPT